MPLVEPVEPLPLSELPEPVLPVPLMELPVDPVPEEPAPEEPVPDELEPVPDELCASDRLVAVANATASAATRLTTMYLLLFCNDLISGRGSNVLPYDACAFPSETPA